MQGFIKKIGLYDKVRELRKDFEIFELSDIQPNPKYDPSVLDDVKIRKENDIDVILAVGGESVLDCSKAIAAGAKYDGDQWDLISYQAFDEDSIPIIDIITLAASYALASLVEDDKLSADYILPHAFDPRVGKTVAEAVRKAAVESGVARIK